MWLIACPRIPRARCLYWYRLAVIFIGTKALKHRIPQMARFVRQTISRKPLAALVTWRHLILIWNIVLISERVSFIIIARRQIRIILLNRTRSRPVITLLRRLMMRTLNRRPKSHLTNTPKSYLRIMSARNLLL